MVYFSKTQENMQSQRLLVAAEAINDSYAARVSQHQSANNTGIYDGLSVSAQYAYVDCRNTCSDQEMARRDNALYVRQVRQAFQEPRVELEMAARYLQLSFFWHDPLKPLRTGACEQEARRGESCITIYKAFEEPSP